MRQIVFVITCNDRITLFQTSYTLRILIDKPGQVPILVNKGSIDYTRDGTGLDFS
jgi:hypothetical protein